MSFENLTPPLHEAKSKDEMELLLTEVRERICEKGLSIQLRWNGEMVELRGSEGLEATTVEALNVESLDSSNLGLVLKVAKWREEGEPWRMAFTKWFHNLHGYRASITYLVTNDKLTSEESIEIV